MGILATNMLCEIAKLSCDIKSLCLKFKEILTIISPCMNAIFKNCSCCLSVVDFGRARVNPSWKSETLHNQQKVKVTSKFSPERIAW